MTMKDLIRRSRYGGAALVAFLLWFPAAVGAVPIVFSVGGNNTAASIQSTVDNFRTLLGDPNNANSPGPLTSGRREINWDGGGATDGTPAITPFLVFQNTRGGRFTTPGSGLTQTPISGGTVDIAPLLPSVQGSLADINPTYATAFSTFSPLRLFVPLDSNVTDALFFVPGTNGAVPATVSGFGAVFVDVDLPDSSHLDFFDIQGNSLGSFNVPPGLVPDASLSFLGVSFTSERIGRVRITSGSVALGPNDNPTGGVDVVVMDDFLYAEPQAIPEPSTLVLVGFGMIVLAGLARKRLFRKKM
jgi:PEP-CTERM motif-containing protein